MTRIHLKHYFGIFGLLAALVAVTGCAPWNAQTRRVAESTPLPAPDAAYIESNRTNGSNYGCSFIEFDGKGGYLSFAQYQHARSILEKRKAKSNVLLVMYCHGWNNNAQSSDVIHFVSFLRHLADAGAIRSNGLRVEGVYLGWRGSQYLPVVTEQERSEDPQILQDFGGEIVDKKWHNSEPVGWLLSPAKYLSYWSIKDRAEFHVSRVPLARAVFGLAFTLKSPTEKSRNHRVFVLGHSFGALVLEQAIGQASVGLLASEWNREQHQARWPFDLIVFLNSAAPSLYAKQLGEFLEEDHRTTAKPRIVSLTSTGDWATGIFHPLGNADKRFAPDLQREYYPFGRAKSGTDPEHYPAVPAWRYYALTPGHNPFLINHQVQKDPSIAPPKLEDPDQIFGWNLSSHNPPKVFFTRSNGDGAIQGWRLVDLTDQADAGTRAALKLYASNYWIATVPPEIIRNHNDIWTPQCMEMLAGIYRTVEQLGMQPAAVHEGPGLRPD